MSKQFLFEAACWKGKGSKENENAITTFHTLNVGGVMADDLNTPMTDDTSSNSEPRNHQKLSRGTTHSPRRRSRGANLTNQTSSILALSVADLKQGRIRGHMAKSIIAFWLR